MNHLGYAYSDLAAGHPEQLLPNEAALQDNCSVNFKPVYAVCCWTSGDSSDIQREIDHCHGIVM